MATLDEIFASMPEETATGTHELLIIDADTREIYVPEIEAIFGVENDGGAETKYFQCPRYVGNGLDLAACFLRINFQNANGDRDSYLVADATANGESIFFSWELSHKVTQYKGTVQFILCASLPGSTKTTDWHTTLATGRALEGLEPDAALVEAAASDVIAQLLALVAAQSENVEAVGAAQVQAVKNEGTTQTKAVKMAAEEAQAAAVAEIEAKGVNTLATIPADYTALGAAVDALERGTAPGIVCAAEGETIQVHDSADKPLQGLRLFGKTTQRTTTGKNLLDLGTITERTINGVTLTPVYENGQLLYMNVNGTSTSTFILLAAPFSIKAGAYVFTNFVGRTAEDAAFHAQICDSAGGLLYPIDTGLGAAHTFAEDTDLMYRIYVGENRTVNNEKIYPMLRLASETDAKYEPYTGGMASPSPDWPQELESVPAPVVAAYGGNILDTDNLVLHANKTLETADAGATVTATGGADKPYTSSIILLDAAMLRGNILIVAADSITNSIAESNGGVQLNIHRGEKVEYLAISPTTLARSLYIGEDITELYFAVYTNNTAAALGTDNTVTVKGLRLNINQVQPWEPYKAAQPLTVANGLPGIPVASGSNYTDANGQQWLCDEVDLGRGVYVQRVGVRSLTGAENFEDYIADNNAVTLYLSHKNNSPVICSHAVYGKGVYWANTSRVAFRVVHFGVSTMEEFKAFVVECHNVGSPVTLCYILAEPVEVPLSEVELAAFAALRSYKPNTTLLNNAGAWMAAEYVADTKLYIDRKLAELIAAGNA